VEGILRRRNSRVRTIHLATILAQTRDAKEAVRAAGAKS
jgi:hypothetical protein